jgi:hypothetical protein
MSDEPATPQPDEPTDQVDEIEDAAEQVELDAYDLDDDGKVSLVENVRGELGMIDAHAEEVAEEPGLKGKLAKAAHKLLDKLDND